MTLKEASGKRLSVSQLSRFETGQSMIPVDLFYEILENINTTPEEFRFLMGSQKEREFTHYFESIEKAVSKKHYGQLESLKKKIIKRHPAPYSWHQFIVYFIDCLILLNEEKKENDRKHQSRTGQQPVLEYLMRIDDWGEMELRLYAMFGFIFEVETTYHLMHTALKKSQLYQSIPQDMKLLHTILTNNFSTFLFYGNLEYAEETIRIFEEEYSENVELLGPHIDFMFNKGILALKKGNHDKAEQLCGQAISICRTFHQKEMGDLLQTRFKGWWRNRNDPDYRELSINLGFFGRFDEENKLR